MSGARRLVVGKITEGNLKGKALEDALARELNSDKMKDIKASEDVSARASDGDKVKNSKD